MNSVCLIGNLTRDPELRQAGETAVGSLRLAVSGRKKEGDEWVDVPNFFNVTVWGRQAELAAEHLTKGRQIAVQGRLQWSEWEAEDGTKRQGVEVVADSLDYLAKPAERVEQGEPVAAAADDDIPF